MNKNAQMHLEAWAGSTQVYPAAATQLAIALGKFIGSWLGSQLEIICCGITHLVQSVSLLQSTKTLIYITAHHKTPQIRNLPTIKMQNDSSLICFLFESTWQANIFKNFSSLLMTNTFEAKHPFSICHFLQQSSLFLASNSFLRMDTYWLSQPFF